MRGRGRGQARGGRGRARGRGGRGGRGRSGRGRGGGRSSGRARSSSQTRKADVKELDVNTNVTDFFTGSGSVDQHYKAQSENRDRYAAGMAVLQKNGVEIVQNARIRALAAAWSRNDYDMAGSFLKDKDNFGLNEVLKALSVLDSGRQIRVLEKKLKRLQVSAGKVKPKTVGKLKSDIDNLAKNKPMHGSASGAVCKHVKRWVKRFTKDELEFYALHLPTEPWKKLADICHFNPKQDFPEMNWFLPFCFGGPAPEGSMVERCRNINEDNVNDLIKEYQIPYAHVKNLLSHLTGESKARIAGYEPKLDTILWYYEELRCPEVEKVILERVEAGNEINIPNGKLLDRLLSMKMYRENISGRRSYHSREEESTERTVDEMKAPFFKHLLPLAQKKIDGISLTLESPIVVLGDASGSMEVAIRTSSIIAGLLTAITSAKLVFFNNEYRYAPYLPKTIEEVLQLAVDTQAGGGTSPVKSLLPFYENKEVVKTFIMVTDEEENGRHEGMYFKDLFAKYYKEVYPAKIVFVSFLSHQHAKGQMVSQLKEMNFEPLQFTFGRSMPDLTKLDKLFGLLSTGSADFDTELMEIETKIRQDGLQKVFDGLTL